MIAFGTSRHGASRRRPLNGLGVDIHKSEWMLPQDAGAALAPTVSLIEQVPDSTLCTHFHRQNQFQLFVDGQGSFGGEELQPVTIHYAGAYTGYGPLVAGPGGLRYFTIRLVPEADAFPVESAASVMRRGPKRHAKVGPVQRLSASQLAELTRSSVQDLLPAADDGLGVSVLRLPAHTALQAQVPVAAAGTFLVVLDGALHHDGKATGPWESIFVSVDESFPQLETGDTGAQVVLMFMPPKALEYC